MNSSLQQDFYSILGVARNATARDVKKRFMQLARERHPDRFSGAEKDEAEKQFQAITEAFNVLSDPVRRRQVDLFLSQPQKRQHDPADVVRVYLNRGIRAYKQGNFLEAANYFNRATQTEPANPQAWHHLALTGMKEERWLPKAQEAIDRACELRPDHVPYLKLAGRIYAMSGVTRRAKQYYNQALKFAGKDASIRKALEELGGAATAGDEAGNATGERAKPGLFRKMW
ncbi:MAG: DnaJ domain-containing protein [Acidobacteriota bacterium]